MQTRRNLALGFSMITATKAARNKKNATTRTDKWVIETIDLILSSYSREDFKEKDRYVT